LFGACRSGRTDLGLQNSYFADRKTDSQSVGLALTARTWALQNCMSLIPKMKQALRVGHDEPYDFKQLVYF
jgi:hypothetical protein